MRVQFLQLSISMRGSVQGIANGLGKIIRWDYMMRVSLFNTCRGNNLGQDWWDERMEEGLVTRLQALNGKQGFSALVAELAAGEIESLDLYQDRSHQLFYAVRGLLNKRTASRLKTIDLRSKI